MQTLPQRMPAVLQPFTGRKIEAKGCYRDACRSTEENVITYYGLKWVCLMLIVPLPWCKRPNVKVTWYSGEIKMLRILSGVNLFAIEILKSTKLLIQSTAWYNKESEATFYDIIDCVRRSIWAKTNFNNSYFEGDYVEIRHDRLESLLDQHSRTG